MVYEAMAQKRIVCHFSSKSILQERTLITKMNMNNKDMLKGSYLNIGKNHMRVKLARRHITKRKMKFFLLLRFLKNRISATRNSRRKTYLYIVSWLKE